MLPTDKLVVITRGSQDALPLRALLEAAGAPVYELPTIRRVKKALGRQERTALAALATYDYLIFTSAQAVTSFMEEADKAGLQRAAFSEVKIAAIGPLTAAAVRERGLSVHLVPRRFTSQDLVRTLPGLTGKKILVSRSEIALPDLLRGLRGKGGAVTEINPYTTLPVQEDDLVFNRLLAGGQVGCLTFTSPSCVAGFPGRLKDSIVLEKALSLPAVCIGPRTAQAALRLGFTRVSCAEPFSVEGMVRTLQELT